MKFYILSTIIFVLISCSSAKKVVIESNSSHIFNVSQSSQNNKIIVDGNLNEWNTNLLYKDNHSTLSTIIVADSSNLYIALLATADWLQLKILKMGMQIYLDTSNNENMQHYIAFPTMQQNDGDDEILKAINKIEKQRLINSAIIMQSKGLQITADGMHMKYNENGLKAALGTDVTGNLVYEASIPLKEIYGNNFFQIIQKKPSLSIGFVINAFPKEDFSHNNKPMNDASHEGKQGEFNNEKPSLNLYNTQDMISDTKLWVKAKF